MKPSAHTLTTGDVYAYLLPRYGVYCPCQVIDIQDERLALVFYNAFSHTRP